MSTYVKPDFEVMAFLPNEYVSVCDYSTTATVTCINGGSVNLKRGYHNGNGLYTFDGGYQLYTDVYTKDADGTLIKDTSIPGVLVGTIQPGHDPSDHPRHDGEYSGDVTEQAIACTHVVIGPDEQSKGMHRHHHLSSVFINNHSA